MQKQNIISIGLWKLVEHVTCKMNIQFNKIKCKHQHIFAFARIGPTIIQIILPNHQNNINVVLLSTI
jgi:hypothetical protein